MFLSAVATLGAMAAVVHAEDVEGILQKGNQLRREGRDAEALAEFRRASRLSESPRTTAQIALAEQALGLWPDAEIHLSGALAHDTDPWIRKNRVALEKALATIHSHLCFVEVWGLPAGASVLIDDRRIGTLPSASGWLIPGDVSFQAKADGYVASRRTLRIPAEGPIREHVSLRPLADAMEGGGSPSGSSEPLVRTPAPPRLMANREESGIAVDGAVPSGPATAPLDATADSSDSSGPSTLRRSAKWISWGGGLVASGIGMDGLLQNRSRVQAFNGVCRVDHATQIAYSLDLTRASDASCISERRDYQLSERVAIAGFVGAAVLGAIGVVLWLTEPSPRDGRTAWASCTPRLGGDLSHGAMLGCEIPFTRF
jgi:hypothetical protein